jgi:hypothetical protein
MYYYVPSPLLEKADFPLTRLTESSPVGHG